jgi:hypothetical protein
MIDPKGSVHTLRDLTKAVVISFEVITHTHFVHNRSELTISRGRVNEYNDGDGLILWILSWATPGCVVFCMMSLKR